MGSAQVEGRDQFPGLQNQDVKSLIRDADTYHAGTLLGDAIRAELQSRGVDWPRLLRLHQDGIAITEPVVTNAGSGPEFPPLRVDSRVGAGHSHHVMPKGANPELFHWWMDTAYEDFIKTLPKADEYGGREQGPATDLFLIGRNLAELCGMHDAPDAVMMELGCWFYMQGKVARLISDYQQQRPGKPDTWFDSSIYAKMARRIQETGQWP